MNTSIHEIPLFTKRVFGDRIEFITTVDGWDVYLDTGDKIRQPYLVVCDGVTEFPHLIPGARNLHCPEPLLHYLRAYHALRS